MFELDWGQLLWIFTTACVVNNFTLCQMEKELILRRLNRTGGNRTRAAEMLGISVRTLRNKINQYRNDGVAIPG